jgi:hypothetical protein
MHQDRYTSLMFNTFSSFWRRMSCSNLIHINVGCRAVSIGHRATFIFAMLLAAFVWATPLRGMAATNVTGTLTTNTVWSLAQSPINLQGDVVLDQGAALTIEPGVQLRMQAGSSFTLRSGSLKAVGTTAQPIVITSAKTTPAPGDWGQWRFLGGTNSAQTQMDNVRIEYGSGVVIEKSSPALNRLAVNHHNGAAISVDLESSPVGHGLSASGNLFNAIVVPAGSIKGQVVWGLVGIPYLVQQGVVVVGPPPIALEPSTLATTRNIPTTMRVVFGGQAPPAGTAINVTSSDANVVYVSHNLGLKSPGGTGQSVEFEIQPYGCGDTVLTATYVYGFSFLGRAQSNVSVECLPILRLENWQGFNESGGFAPQLPYTVKVVLPHEAPAGGQIVRLSAPNWVDVPASVTVPQGQTSIAFTVIGKPLQGDLPAYATLTAQADGYESASYGFRVESLHLYMDAPPVSVGASSFFSFGLNVEAPQGGLRVLLESSDPTVFDVAASELTLPEGETGGGISLLGKRQGQARLRIYVPNMVEYFVDVTVSAPTTTSANNKEVRQ